MITFWLSAREVKIIGLLKATFAHTDADSDAVTHTHNVERLLGSMLMYGRVWKDTSVARLRERDGGIDWGAVWTNWGCHRNPAAKSRQGQCGWEAPCRWSRARHPEASLCTAPTANRPKPSPSIWGFSKSVLPILKRELNGTLMLIDIYLWALTDWLVSHWSYRTDRIVILGFGLKERRKSWLSPADVQEQH